MIPYGRQEITKEDIVEVKKVLKSDFLTQGPIVPKFEKKVADYCNSNFAVAVNSATSALHIACMALNLGPGDLLWTSPNTFVASANCGLYCGANIDFVDIDPISYNMSIDALTDKLTKADKSGKLPKVVIPVHFAGQPCDMLSIYNLSKKYGFKIIEDASHAIGASYNSIKIGSCRHSDITVFSFHPVKIITTGEGGMALTNNENLANKMRRLSCHGITKKKELMKKRPASEIWNYQQIELGFNYRMTDIQAALGLSQLKRLDNYIKIRHKIAKKYFFNLFNTDLITPLQKTNIYSSFHLYPIRIKKIKSQIAQKKMYNIFLQKGVAVNLHYIPVHRHPYYEKLGFKSGDFPEAETYYNNAISLPLFSQMSFVDQDKVVTTLSKALK